MMNIGDELRFALLRAFRVKPRQIVEPPLHLPFDGELSPSERRMMEQMESELSA